MAGAKHPGKKAGDIRWYGRQSTTVPLSNRRLRIEKPRLRRTGRGRGKEVETLACEAIIESSPLGGRILEILMRGVSSRNYQRILPKMAETLGVSKSNVSREFIEASEQTLRSLCERRFDDQDMVVVCIDGLQYGPIHVIAALGVDPQGYKHVLGLWEGASENAQVVKDLLADLVEQGLNPQRRRLFVIDGSKALWAAIHEVFGSATPIQRCRNHKVRNVLGYLPDERKADVEAAMKAAFKLKAEEGIAKLEKLAQWLERVSVGGG